MHHVEADVPATERLIQEEHRTYSPSLGEPRPRSRRSKEEDVEEEDDEKHVLKPTWFIWMLVVAAGVSGLLFGYECVISPPSQEYGARRPGIGD